VLAAQVDLLDLLWKDLLGLCVVDERIQRLVDHYVRHSSHRRCEVRVKVLAQCEMHVLQLFLFLVLWPLLRLFENVLHRIMIQHVPRTFLHPPALKVHILPHSIINRLIILNLMELFLHSMNVLKIKTPVEELESLVEHFY
jgi:hypothetical protein